MARSTLADKTATIERSERRAFHGRRVGVIATILGAIILLVVVGAIASRAKPTLAQLRVRAADVDIVHAGKGSVRASDGADVELGDVIKTSDTGQAVVGFVDGSVTRLDSNTRISIRQLQSTRSGDQIAIALASGRVWDHVRDATSPKDSFQVRLSNVVMSSSGSTFLTDCRTSDACYVVDFDGTTHVAAKNGDELDLDVGNCAQIAPDGSLDSCDATKLGLIDSWVRSNLAEDQELATPEVTSAPSPTPSPSAVSSSGSGFVPRPVSRPPVRSPAKTAPPSTPVPTKDKNNDGVFPTPPPTTTPKHHPHGSPNP